MYPYFHLQTGILFLCLHSHFLSLTINTDCYNHFIDPIRTKLTLCGANWSHTLAQETELFRLF